jgi:hypothetical protein
MRSIAHAIAVGTVSLAACANDPTYVQCPPGGAMPDCVTSLEIGIDDGTGTMTNTSEVKSKLLLPIRVENTDDNAARVARSAELGVEVPYVKLGDIEVSVEWTIKNLEAEEGIVVVELDGATEFFEYDPDLIVLDTDDDAPPTPGLEGNIPLRIPGNGVVSGIFREDQVREASIDCEQVTRANVNPFAATLTINKNDDQIQPLTPFDPTMPDVMQMPAGPAIPREAFANLVRLDLVFATAPGADTRHMVLEYTVRVRDVRGKMLHDELYEAPADELFQFNIQGFGTP